MRATGWVCGVFRTPGLRREVGGTVGSKGLDWVIELGGGIWMSLEGLGGEGVDDEPWLLESR
jgi:hypothetical protein